MPDPRYPCAFKMHGHQYFGQGICHGLAINQNNGRPYALIEFKDGLIKTQYLDEGYYIELGEAI